MGRNTAPTAQWEDRADLATEKIRARWVDGTGALAGYIHLSSDAESADNVADFVEDDDGSETGETGRLHLTDDPGSSAISKPIKFPDGYVRFIGSN